MLGDEYAEYVECERNRGSYGLIKKFNRVVNGVRYIDDYIVVHYNVINKNISSVSFWNKKENVKTIEPSMDGVRAYDILLEKYPLKKIYAPMNGVYKVCFTTESSSIEIDGITGEMKNTKIF